MLIVQWHLYCDGLGKDGKPCTSRMVIESELAHEISTKLDGSGWLSVIKQCEKPRHFCSKCSSQAEQEPPPKKPARHKSTPKQKLQMKIAYRKQKLKLYQQANQEDQRMIERIENQGRVIR